MLDAGATVVLAGGGGVPVVPDELGFRGIEAIVDKDYVAARVAVDIDAQMLVILTDTPGTMSNFGTPSQVLPKTLKIQDIEGEPLPGWAHWAQSLGRSGLRDYQRRARPHQFLGQSWRNHERSERD